VKRRCRGWCRVQKLLRQYPEPWGCECTRCLALMEFYCKSCRGEIEEPQPLPPWPPLCAGCLRVELLEWKLAERCALAPCEPEGRA
jgi:hypothetical protein